jgi:hypothetical protein
MAIEAASKETKHQRATFLDASVRKLIDSGPGIDLSASTTFAIFLINKPIRSKGKRTFGSIQILPPLHKQLSGVDLLIVIEEEMTSDDLRLEALFHHLLCSVYTDEESSTIKPFAFDYQGYAANVKAYGDWTHELESLKIAETTYQLSLMAEDK